MMCAQQYHVEVMMQLEQLEFNELNNKKDEQHEHNHNDSRSIRHRKINKPTQYDSRKHAVNSSDSKATPF